MELGKWAEFHKFSGLGNYWSFPENLKFSRKRGVSCKREVFTKKLEVSGELGNWHFFQELRVDSESESSLGTGEFTQKLGVEIETGSFLGT